MFNFPPDARKSMVGSCDIGREGVRRITADAGLDTTFTVEGDDVVVS